MKLILTPFIFIAFVGYSQTESFKEFPQWSTGKPSIQDVTQDIGDKSYLAQEFIQAKLVQERTGEELTVDKLMSGGFTTLYFDYYYLYDLKFGKSNLSNFTINIPLLKQGEKIRELEVIEYSIDPKGELSEIKSKNIVKERKKIDNDRYNIEVKIEGITPGAFYQISYIIRSSNMKECSPRVLEGDLHEKKTRFAFDVPDILKIRTNYDTLGFFPSLVSQKSWYLDKYSIKYGRSGPYGYETINCTVYKWIFDEPNDFFSQVYFDVVGISVPAKNDYGLDPKKFVAKSKQVKK